ncbi:nucleotidyltransferase family protein [Candidatus Bipolaricaulota bacterium]|nr:nucleotidyltransferase family protein [Candidatus Bipolaricaulota bacterium]
MTGVVLAAGAGRRMTSPGPKLLLPLNGWPILAWVLELVERLPLAERVLVLGADAQAIRQALFPPHPGPLPQGGEGGGRWRIVINEDWHEGIGASLRRAAEEVEGGMLLFLGDMPWVPEAGARAVLARVGDRPVALSYRGQRGFPVYLPPSLRPGLLALAGDVGARWLLSDCELIPWDDPGVIRDVDVADDLGQPRPTAGIKPDATEGS